MHHLRSTPTTRAIDVFLWNQGHLYIGTSFTVDREIRVPTLGGGDIPVFLSARFPITTSENALRQCTQRRRRWHQELTISRSLRPIDYSLRIPLLQTYDSCQCISLEACSIGPYDVPTLTEDAFSLGTHCRDGQQIQCHSGEPGEVRTFDCHHEMGLNPSPCFRTRGCPMYRSYSS